MFRRTFECGHPDEFIEARSLGDGETLHNIITFEVFKEHDRANNRPVYIDARCLNCAKTAKRKDDHDPNVQPKKRLGAYISGTSSICKEGLDVIIHDGFERSLERYRRSDHKHMTRRHHPSVSQEEHRAHHLEIQEEAVACPGTWLAVPARRVTNIPIRVMDESETATQRGYVFHSFAGKDRALLQVKVDGKQTDSQNDALQPHSNADPVESLFESKRDQFKCIEDTLLIETRPHATKDGDCPSRKSMSRTEDKGIHLVAKSLGFLSGLRLGRQRKHSNGSVSTANNSEASSLSGGTETCHRHAASRPGSCKKESAVTEHVDEYPLDDTFKSSPARLKYENPRTAPLAPKRRLLSFRKRRSSATTRSSTQSEPGTKHIRTVSLDLMQSAMSFNDEESRSESPDWACQTSLAIEAGRLSMDSVSLQRRGAASSQHIYEAVRSPTDNTSSDYQRKQDVRKKEIYGAHSSPRIDPNPIASAACRHPEGSLQLSRKDSTTLPQRKSDNLETVMEKESPRRERAQVASLIDLNKSLPALPSREDARNSGDWI
ncbi:hypothetical protein OPT61_g4472 [Boeremia exigua]|uniref:Uncharacterized protein n=1 Tax=Boeremia exigua TaxID=749465 RepID=A0ACC2IE40_9PLEO|nr:hypothetical protein OPT61_g4472 [Boeremia exigua]